MNTTLTIVAAITYGLLFFASLITRAVLFSNPKSETFNKVWVITKSWWLIVTFLIGVFALAPLGLLIGFGFLSILAAREYFRHSRLNGYRKILLGVLVAFIVIQYIAFGLLRFDIFQILPLLFILVNFPLFIVLSGEIKKLPQIFSSLAGPLLFFHFLAYLPGLYLLGVHGWKNESQALLAVFLVIFLTELNDIFQFICGKSFGRRKIFPVISPNKTEAGFLGGMVGTTLLSTLVFPSFLELSLWQSVFLGILISYFGMLGDLMFSAIKRYFDTKDFSEALPGHGGFLDRLDSLFLTVPIAFYALWYMKGGF
jgi:phosphatidate cytidylyltransferase